MRGVPDEEIGLAVDCRSVADRIVAGLSEHRSQLHLLSDDPTDADTWMRRVGREWAVLAFPPRPSGAPLLTDVIDGPS